MPLTPLDAAGVAFYQTNVTALAELHRGIAALAEAADVDTLLAQGEKLKARLRELCPHERSDGWPVQQWITEHTKLTFLAQLREMTDTRQRLFDNPS
ncbi:hypothetical protein ALQ32_200070 [Pseudomonas syringae pv. tagetis]|uniref:Uncharacterized protein n=2 Tax=Pseudomonas syringae group TaxID=136849 RepID=A0A3M3V5A0_PSESG|nr:MULTISPECIES: hypothetical protein [Pseudomonas syringae group]RMO40714.1 hypothetical protein ALQ42_200045 [Pseudomonas savastanoi pv. glycinea]RMO46158.1 hypothetical protein ALQ43_200171 [Pseudomonas savastanoi pv. glycinea]RMO93703.1 hypothetical protein ALQ32_200070 [Pseudomonas syringae pv. tagetis]RMU05331.1 hypothetical protein ALP35_200197 [Pseudomonas savastanoi pv. glycinea]RMU14694.1 hypothetical protein ALP34_03908 [Pseudomonas savastanoi pv. glycinea]